MLVCIGSIDRALPDIIWFDQDLWTHGKHTDTAAVDVLDLSALDQSIEAAVVRATERSYLWFAERAGWYFVLFLVS